ncbi:SRPBCC family protein [Bacillus sp. FJAT-49736]|uniref:SRPBCC family protein n=1 Tax=Bacillus sp. FJAT-49736 TaxID=2833582 RepID=UPI001BC9CA94|nr:SRPBCC family protein [Bacillus sp. FJAT-49736]MBS4174463.1 SRPBCC family protein [Bacillus sp. FJAT-49736]MBS4175820.1 SRPBCC family protein [Bacillus sp. FJAT-49736]
MAKPSFIYVTYIASTPEQVWDALTTGETTEKYFFGRKVVSNWKEGSDVTYLRENDELDVFGKVLISKPYDKLAFTWFHADEKPMRKEPSIVTFELQPLEGTVKLTLKHEHISDGDIIEEESTFAGLNNGWPAILSNLKSLLETGKTLPAVVV